MGPGAVVVSLALSKPWIAASWQSARGISSAGKLFAHEVSKNSLFTIGLTSRELWINRGVPSACGAFNASRVW